jgi:cyclophilin family peptidyl-prolyl cis-trans isomerase
MKVRKLLCISILLAISTLGISSCKTEQAPEPKKRYAVFESTKGIFKMELRDDKAPQTCSRIRELVQKGFYNGLLFHRVVPDFVVQTGDPEGTGSGGSGKKIPPEFNDLKHIKGAVGMARRVNDVNSADSQFYVVMGTYSELDGSYTVFATITDGMPNIEKIVQGDRIVKAWLE